MPELPEVETVRRGANQVTLNREITGGDVLLDRTIAYPFSVADFLNGISGKAIAQWHRRGKYLLAELVKGSREQGAIPSCKSQVASRKSQLIPNSEFRIPNSAHAPLTEYPDTVALNMWEKYQIPTKNRHIDILLLLAKIPNGQHGDRYFGRCD